MSEQPWAKEPWKSDNGHITDVDGGYVGYLTDFLEPEQARILACISACAGIPTEVLVEHGVVPAATATEYYKAFCEHMEHRCFTKELKDG